MYNNDLFKMNLQLFAEEPQTEPAQQEPAPETEPAPERKYTQAEVDAAIATRLSRANKDAEKRIEAARQEARSEAEKLAKMNAEQRAEHERQEAEINRNGRTCQAQTAGQTAGYPQPDPKTLQ